MKLEQHSPLVNKNLVDKQKDSKMHKVGLTKPLASMKSLFNSMASNNEKLLFKSARVLE